MEESNQRSSLSTQKLENVSSRRDTQAQFKFLVLLTLAANTCSASLLRPPPNTRLSLNCSMQRVWRRMAPASLLCEVADETGSMTLALLGNCVPLGEEIRVGDICIVQGQFVAPEDTPPVFNVQS